MNEKLCVVSRLGVIIAVLYCIIIANQWAEKQDAPQRQQRIYEYNRTQWLLLKKVTKREDITYEDYINMTQNMKDSLLGIRREDDNGYANYLMYRSIDKLGERK
jgi:hypothetical protein